LRRPLYEAAQAVIVIAHGIGYHHSSGSDSLRFYISAQSRLVVAAGISIIALLALGLVVILVIRHFADMVVESAPGPSGLACQNCNSKSIHASYPSGLTDKAFGWFACVPYRCEVCSFRFYLRRQTTSAEGTRSARWIVR